MKRNSADIVTPFDWQRYTAPAAAAPSKTASRKSKKKQPTVRERIARIMATRWGNPYCKPGTA